MPAFDLFEGGFTRDPFQKHANRIFNCSIVGANQMRRLATMEMAQTIWIRILYEYLFFYVVVTREIGLFGDSDERKNRVTEGLIEELLPASLEFVFHDATGHRKDDRRAKAEVVLRDRLAEYGEFDRVIPAKGLAKLSQTSLGRFCVIVSKAAGEPMDPTHMSTARTHIQDSVDILNMDIFTAMVT